MKNRPELKDNKFIQDLIYDLNNKTVSHNTENVLALPTTMLPRTDAERTLFNVFPSLNDVCPYVVSSVSSDVKNLTPPSITTVILLRCKKSFNILSPIYSVRPFVT